MGIEFAEKSRDVNTWWRRVTSVFRGGTDEDAAMPEDMRSYVPAQQVVTQSVKIVSVVEGNNDYSSYSSASVSASPEGVEK